MNWLTKISLVFTVGILLASCTQDEEETAIAVRPVVYQVVNYSGAEQIRTFSGTAETDKVIDLSFRSSGILTRLNMRVGQAVRKGQLLAELDNVQARLNLEQAVSALNSAASQMNTAKLNFDRVKALYEQGSASLSDFENAKNSFRTAEAGYESSQRTVEIQEEQVSYGYMYAPENGTIASVNVELDENVTVGRTVAVLNAGTSMEIALGLPESVINRVSNEMPAVITFSSVPGVSFSGTVSEVSPSLNSNTATFPVRVSVLNPTSDIRSGMTANVQFDFGRDAEIASGLYVPAKAIGKDGNGNFVFLIDEQGAMPVVRKHPVEVGPLTNEGFEILDGLAAGQKIATAGLQTLLDGQQVQLQ